MFGSNNGRDEDGTKGDSDRKAEALAEIVENLEKGVRGESGSKATSDEDTVSVEDFRELYKPQLSDSVGHLRNTATYRYAELADSAPEEVVRDLAALASCLDDSHVVTRRNTVVAFHRVAKDRPMDVAEYLESLALRLDDQDEEIRKVTAATFRLVAADAPRLVRRYVEPLKARVAADDDTDTRRAAATALDRALDEELTRLSENGDSTETDGGTASNGRMPEKENVAEYTSSDRRSDTAVYGTESPGEETCPDGGRSVTFCPACGANLGEYETVTYCSQCGSDISP